MAALFEDVSTSQRQSYEAGLFKTYMVEANLPSATSELDQSQSLLETWASLSGVQISPTSESGFYVGTKQARQNNDVYFVDAVDSRFWMIHTPTVTSRSDRLLQNNIYQIRGLDTAWIPSEMLKSIGDNAQSQIGIGTHYSDSDTEEDEDKQTNFSMRVWGNIAESVTAVLNDDPNIRRYMALSSVRVKSYEEDDLTSNDTVYYNGKITVNGNSFSGHNRFSTNVFRRRYKQSITSIESDHSVRITSNNRYAGAPLFIDYSSTPESDIASSIAALVSGKRPYRFWGHLDASPSGRVRCVVSDLHLGGRFSISADAEGMQIYAFDGVCGNAIARWLTLFQQTVNATARLVGPNGELTFA